MDKKKLMQDMVPKSAKKDLREVPVRKVEIKKTSSDKAEKYFEKKTQVSAKEPKAAGWTSAAQESSQRFSRPRLKYLSIICVIAFAALTILALKSFGRVYVEIIPREKFFEVDAVFKSAHNQSSQIGLETLRFESELEKNAKVSGSQKVEKPAGGRIVIYNSFSTAPQLLVRRTRFETPDGKIFRILQNVTVPGAVSQGGALKPGSVEADVVADEPGEKYNIGLSDFTIPGFKGTPRYDKFYARSKTPMTGGFSGVSPVVAKADVEGLESALKEELGGIFLAMLHQELPAGFIVPDGGTILAVEDVKRTHEAGDPSDAIGITMRASFVAFAAKSEDINTSLVNKYLADELKGASPETNAIKIVNLGELEYFARNLNFNSQTMDLAVVGSAKAVWQFDENKLKSELVSAASGERLSVFNKFPEIAKAQIIFRPSWWRLFPKDSDKIKVIIKTAE